MLSVLCSISMELPNFINKISKEEKAQKDYFWALEIWDGGVKSAIWTIDSGVTKVISLGSQENWQGGSDNLVEAVDQSFSNACEHFPGLQDEEPSRVIFGLPYDWIKEEKITPEKQEFLHGIRSKLDLAPIGFVLTIDALNHYLKETEGVPPSTILVNPQSGEITVSLIELGKVKGVKVIKRSDHLAEDVFKILTSFEEIENFPARIMLFNGHNESLEEARQALIDFPWQKLPFLHFPKVEILPQDFDLKAICLSGGREAARNLGFEITKESAVDESVLPSQAQDETEPIEEEVSSEPQIEEDQKKDEDKEVDFGFVRGQDILAGGSQKIEEGSSQEPEPIESLENSKTIEEEQILPHEEKSPKKIRLLHLPRPKIPSFGGLLVIVVLMAVLLLGAGSVLAFFWYVARAEIVVWVTPKTLSSDFELRVDPNQEVIDPDSRTLPGKIIDTEVSGDASEATTGKKTVGEKAKGEVTIYNTGSTRKLAAGTTLIGPGSLKFVLDDEVEVASGSGAAKATMIKAAVTASVIGADYNLASETDFSVGNIDKSVIQAKNETEFSGGTSREIQAVSEEDLKKLATKLTRELEEQAKNELLAKVPPGKKLVEQTITTKEVSRKFDKKVGEEAEGVSLNLKTKASALSFSEEEFLEMAKKQMKDMIEENWEARNENIVPEFEFKERAKDGSVLFKVKISADLMPKFSYEAVIEQIAGNSDKAAREYIDDTPGFVELEIVPKPHLPINFLILPKKTDRITLELRSR